MAEKIYKSEYRVYYEDTDAGGIVYYANYLKFAERARTDLLRDLDISQVNLAKDPGIIFVVKTVEIDYLKPGRLDDLLNIETTITHIGKASIHFKQEVFANNQKLASMMIIVVCINHNFKPTPVPDYIRNKI